MELLRWQSIDCAVTKAVPTLLQEVCERGRAGFVAAFMMAALPDVDASFVLGVVLSSGASAVVAEVVVAGCAGAVIEGRVCAKCQGEIGLRLVLLCVDGVNTTTHLLHH